MKKVLFVAPFESNGRYKGGIMSIANDVFTKLKLFQNNNIELIKFNVNFRKRKNFSVGKLSFENIIHFFCTTQKIIQESKKNNCNIVYYNTSKALGILKDAFVIKILRIFNKKIKIIMHIHFADYDKIMPSKKFLEKLLLKIFIKSIDEFVFLSKKTRNEFINHGISECKTSVLYNFHNYCISKDRINAKILEYDSKDYLELLFMGSIDKRKGIVDLLEVLNKISMPYKLHLCGICNDASTKPLFDRKIKNFGDNIIIHGYVEETEKLDVLYKSDVMILPTYGEGFPVVLVEGMAFGCAIATTPVGAIPEFVRPEFNGYIFEPGNITQIVSVLEKLFYEKELTKDYMLNNYNDSLRFNLDCFINNLIKIILKVSKDL